MGQPRQFSDKNIRKGFSLVKAGMSWTAAAAAIGITREGLRIRCRRIGLVAPRRTNGIYRLHSLKMPTSSIDLSYLAAVVDCEGFIGTLKAHTRKRPYWAIGIANTDTGLIDWLRGIGGGVCIHKKRGSHKKKFDWWLRARADVFVFLHVIEPFLKMKRDKAVMAIKDYGRYFESVLNEGKTMTRQETVNRLNELLAYERRDVPSNR